MSAQLAPLPSMLLPVDAVAQRFGVHPDTVRRWCKAGLLRYFRGPKTLRIHADSVADAIARGLLTQPRRIGRGAR